MSREIARDCPMCGTTTTATVESADMFRWQQGTPTQDAFPYLDRATREAVFISGICAACFNALVVGA